MGLLQAGGSKTAAGIRIAREETFALVVSAAPFYVSLLRRKLPITWRMSATPGHVTIL